MRNGLVDKMTETKDVVEICSRIQYNYIKAYVSLKKRLYKHSFVFVRNFLPPKKILFILSLFFSSGAKAQVSVQERMNFKPSPWSYSYFGLLSHSWQELERGGARLSTYNFLTAAYRVSQATKVAVRLPFSYNSFGFDDFNKNAIQDQELLLQDIFISYLNYNLILLPFDIGVFWEGRVYLPTSQTSQDMKMISRFRNDFVFSKYFSSEWVVEYVSKLNYFYQSQTAYPIQFIDENGFEVNTISRTKKLFYDHWFNIWYRFKPTLSVGWQAGWEDTYFNRSEANRGFNKPGRHVYKLGPQVAFELSSNANFIFQVAENLVNENRKDLGKFRTENLHATLLAFVRF